MDRREKMLAGIDLKSSAGVEIGALDKPFVHREDGQITYVDHADTDSLIEKYRDDPNVNTTKIVRVDAVWGAAQLAEIIAQRVDYVVASHVVEHVPDLITWLNELRSILKPCGSVRLAVPDRRFTFDIRRRETELQDVLAAFAMKARVPQPNQMLDHYMGVSNVDPYHAWEGSIEPAKLPRRWSFDKAMQKVNETLESGTYNDVHCWVFTPRSFALLFADMAEHSLIDFACEHFFDTEKKTIEFFVSLKPSDDRGQIIDSWNRMADQAHDDAPLSLTRQLRLAQLQLSASKNQGDRSAAEITDLRGKLENSEQRIASLENSTSWRVTRPLRSISDRLGIHFSHSPKH